MRQSSRIIIIIMQETFYSDVIICKFEKSNLVLSKALSSETL